MISAAAVKQTIILGIWIAIGFAFIPLARRKGRSTILWYLFGLGAFYIPFLTLLFGPILLFALSGRRGHEAVEELGMLILICLPIALFAGWHCVRRLRRHLDSL